MFRFFFGFPFSAIVLLLEYEPPYQQFLQNTLTTSEQIEISRV